MAFVLADRVKETTTTTGTGTITLAGASTGFQSFAAIGNTNTTYYTIAGLTSGEWEVGVGTYTASGTTLSRDTVLASSNSGSLVDFSAGSKDVFCDYPAGKAIYTDPSGVSAVTTATNVAGGAANKVVYQTGAGASGFVDAPTTTGTSLTWNGSAFTWASAAAFASGTVMLFKQTSAPTGWTKDTTAGLDNSALRIVTGSVSSGGSVAFTTAFASQAVAGTIANTTAGGTVGSTTLSTAQMPSHSHPSVVAGGVAGTGGPCSPFNVTNGNTGSTGSGSSHNHSFSGTAHNHSFTGTAINLAVKYVDIIVATKD